MARIIKKYPNRRLYDTVESRYITLDDLKRLIVSGAAIEVRDAKTKRDITRDVLLQLVAEQESHGQPILSETILTALIRFYDHPMQKLASNYLEAALSQLQEQRERLGEQMKGLMESPLGLAGELTRQNIEWMQQLQQSFLKALSPGKQEKPDSRSDDT